MPWHLVTGKLGREYEVAQRVARSLKLEVLQSWQRGMPLAFSFTGCAVPPLRFFHLDLSFANALSPLCRSGPLLAIFPYYTSATFTTLPIHLLRFLSDVDISK